MSAVRLPVERAFATGNQGATLVLMICSGWLWAGLYASPYSEYPSEVAAAPSLGASIGVRKLVVGHHAFKLSNSSLQATRRWLDRHGVRVRVTTPHPAKA